MRLLRVEKTDDPTKGPFTFGDMPGNYPGRDGRVSHPGMAQDFPHDNEKEIPFFGYMPPSDYYCAVMDWKQFHYWFAGYERKLRGFRVTEYNVRKRDVVVGKSLKQAFFRMKHAVAINHYTIPEAMKHATQG